jgi:hypothetical protein
MEWFFVTANLIRNKLKRLYEQTTTKIKYLKKIKKIEALNNV